MVLFVSIPNMSWQMDYVFQVGDDPRDVKYWLRVFRYQEKELERPFAVVHVEDSVFQRADMVWHFP